MTQVKSDGFTIIELMLSMTFLSMLMLVIALTTIQISNIYNKGVTLREVDQAGRSVSASLQRSIAAAVPFNTTKSVSAPSSSQYIVRGDGGRLCLGNYTYAWTYGPNIASPTLNKYLVGGAAVRFAKIADPGASLCKGNPGAIDATKASELLTSGDRDLVVQSFDIHQTASEPITGEALYAISMIIGTSDTTQLLADKSACKPPSGIAGADNYCSVNQFDIIAHAGNTVQ